VLLILWSSTYFVEQPPIPLNFGTMGQS